MITCPGCAGRNAPDERACQWCGRPFVDEQRQFAIPWLIPATAGALVLLVVGTIAIALVGARPAGPDTPEPTAISPFVATGVPQVETPSDLDTSEPLAPLVEEAVAVAQGDIVRIGNTGGVGAFIRREPRANAPGIVAHRDGTVLRVVGTDTQVAGRVWRNVEDQAGNRGWTPGEYLVATDGAR